LAALVAKDLAKKKIMERSVLTAAAAVLQAQQELQAVMGPLEVTAVAAEVLLVLDYQAQAGMELFRVAVAVEVALA
jgi:hypothetical protein